MKTRDCRFDKQARIRRARRDPAERIRDFDPVDISLTVPEAIGEAERCLMSVTCEACEVCILICPDLCITRDEDSGKIVIDLDYCKACGLCAQFCPREAIQMVEEEVMSEIHPQFTQDHEIFRKSVRSFVEQELLPNIPEWEREGIFPRSVFEKMGELGFLGIRVPEEYGGSGLDWWFTAVLVEELGGCHCAGVPMGLLVQSDMATPVISDLGTHEQKKEFLEPAVKGEKIAALAVTEPDAGSDVASLRTTARRDGDDYVISGSKTFITNGTRADFLTLAVRTGDAGFGGISFVLFPTDTKGFQVASKLDKLGNRSSDTAELSFDECRIPRRYLLGEENQGFIYIMQNFEGERLVAAVASAAGAQRVIDAAVEYAKDRKAFGRPLIGFQVTRHNFADMLTKTAAARQLAYHAVDLINRGLPCTREVAMAKLFCTELAVEVSTRCLQVYGGYGYMEEYEIARNFRDTRLLTIGGGASEIMKEIITKLSGM